MAAGWQLRDLLSALRAETGKSTNTAMGINERDALVLRLRMTQELLAAQYDWPSLEARRVVELVPGGRYYSFPADMPFDAVQRVFVRERARDAYMPVLQGIGPEQYTQTDSDAGDTAWPVLRWGNSEGQLEFWPIPDRTAYAALSGQRVPKPLVNDSDVSELDGNIVVLFAAADILARQGAEDAQLVLARGQKMLRMVLVRQDANKTQAPLVLGGGPPVAPGGVPRQRFRVPR